MPIHQSSFNQIKETNRMYETNRIADKFKMNVNQD